MGMIITFNTATYFDLAVGACGVLNAIITICVTIAYIAIEFGDDK
jgi:energy-converting hydrogenase Eha subunit C